MNNSAFVKYCVNTLFFFALMSLMVSCHDDSDDMKGGELDPAAMSRDIVLGGGDENRVSGELPESSSDPLAPALEPETDSIFFITYSHKNIFPTLVSGSAKGFYVKIKGADDYFKIESTSAGINYSSGPEDLVFGFVVNNGPKAGTFVIQYSVYDEENRASNIIERTVIVLDLGGKDSEFLSAKTWSLTQRIYSDHNPRDTIFAGKISAFQYEETLDCYGQPDKTVQIVDEWALTSELYTFDTDGKFKITSTSYSKEFDWLESTNSCSLQYDIQNPVSDEEGKWAYYGPAKRLVLSFSFVVYEYKVVPSHNNTFVLMPMDRNTEIIVLE